MKKASLIIVAAAVAAIVGSLLPWATAGPFSVAGTSGDGVITLLAGVATIAIVLAGGAIWAAIIGGLIITAVSIYDLQQLSAIAPGPFGLHADPGSGLVLVLLAGGVLLGVACIEAVN